MERAFYDIEVTREARSTRVPALVLHAIGCVEERPIAEDETTLRVLGIERS